jgi:hypothetical protein
MIVGRDSVLYRVKCRHGRSRGILVLGKGGGATGGCGHVGRWTRLGGIRMAHMLVLVGRFVPRAGVSPAAATIPGCEDAGGRVPDAVGTRLRLITLGLLRSTSLARMRGARPVAWTCRGLALGGIRDGTLAAHIDLKWLAPREFASVQQHALGVVARLSR